MGNQLIVIQEGNPMQEGNPLLLLCEAAGSMGTCIEIEDGHEVFVSFCMLTAVVFIYSDSISNLSSTRIQVLKRHFLAMRFSLLNFASVSKLWPLLQKGTSTMTISNFRRL